MYESVGKELLGRSAALCIKVSSDSITFSNNDAYFLDFRAQKFPLIFFNSNPF